jgi:hypothetical protein
MSVADELTRGENSRHKLGAEDDCVEPAFQEADHMCPTVTLEPPRLLIDAAELALGDVSVIAAQLLLGLKLHAVVGKLALAALAMLARPIFAPIHRAFGTTPDVLTHPAVDLVLGFHALGHSRPRLSLLLMRIAPSSVPARPEPTGKTS